MSAGKSVIEFYYQLKSLYSCNYPDKEEEIISGQNILDRELKKPGVTRELLLSKMADLVSSVESRFRSKFYSQLVDCYWTKTFDEGIYVAVYMREEDEELEQVPTAKDEEAFLY